MYNQSVLASIAAICIDIILAKVLTFALWRDLSKALHESMTTTDFELTGSVLAALGDITLFGLVVVIPGFFIVNAAAQYIRSWMR